MRHKAAESAAALHIGSRAATAAKHNQRASLVVDASRAQRARNVEKRARNLRTDMDAHEERRQGMVNVVRTRGSDEVCAAAVQ